MKACSTRFSFSVRWVSKAKILYGLIIHKLLCVVVSLHTGRSKSVSDALLIVRLDAIGDFIVWLHSAMELRKAFPNRHIVLAGSAIWADLARQLPYWDEVISVDVKRLEGSFGYRLKVLRTVARRGFSIAVQPTHSRTLLSDEIIKGSKARERIGAVGDLTHLSRLQKHITDRWYTKLLPTAAIEMSELERNREFMHSLMNGDAHIPIFRLPTVAILRNEFRFEQAYCIIFPGASWSGRQWPIAAFAEFIATVCQPRGWLPVICGSVQETPLCDAVASSAGVHCVNLAGKTTLAELCEVIRSARLLVGNETSAIHIAAALGVPCVCILGGGHFGRFVPYPADYGSVRPESVFNVMPCFGCNWDCHMPHLTGSAVPCITSISPAMVIDTAERVLRTSAVAGSPNIGSKYLLGGQ